MNILDLLFRKQINTKHTLKDELTSKKCTDALSQVFTAYSYYGDEKHVFNHEIISNFSHSQNPDDILAVAISYLNEGASSRANAIEYFEKYLLAPSDQKYFSTNYILFSLSALYEKEHFFNKALFYLDEIIKLDKENNVNNYIRKGNILLKQDIDSAISYYENLKKTKIYKLNEKIIDDAYSNILTKKKNGYKYRPRKTNNR